MRTLLIQLHSEGFDAAVEEIALVFRGVVADYAAAVLTEIAARAPEEARRIASFVENRLQEKHHRYLGYDLLIEDYARTHLDPVGARLGRQGDYGRLRGIHDTWNGSGLAQANHS